MQKYESKPAHETMTRVMLATYAGPVVRLHDLLWPTMYGASNVKSENLLRHIVQVVTHFLTNIPSIKNKRNTDTLIYWVKSGQDCK